MFGMKIRPWNIGGTRSLSCSDIGGWEGRKRRTCVSTSSCWAFLRMFTVLLEVFTNVSAKITHRGSGNHVFLRGFGVTGAPILRVLPCRLKPGFREPRFFCRICDVFRLFWRPGAALVPGDPPGSPEGIRRRTFRETRENTVDPRPRSPETREKCIRTLHPPRGRRANRSPDGLRGVSSGLPGRRFSRFEAILAEPGRLRGRERP